MILLPCPWCGLRDSEEFGYVGEPRGRPNPLTTTTEQWRDYLYLRRNAAGWTTERWYHRMGCRRYLLVERDTTTNVVRPAGQVAPEPEP
ncbi:MAG: sarcosine oxidase subunit delta [Ornithinimicrobium sp.]|jgi:heterotetrameric sarcosine oxidase delta subunit|uniref:sarcosine oxidase subunit delta n=1 Tax=Ornithinimicrobium sp. TaxID=1977084 RepID=UPI0027C2DBD6|nr:sarcosine oxidase subunit delta [Actinomycetota bacterium]